MEKLPAQTPKNFFQQDFIKQKFVDMFKNEKKATSFITSILQITTSNELLSKADPTSIYQAAMVSATLELPLNNNLGFAYIVPFNDRKSGKCLAQFQLGYKGFIQLAQRSGQFKTINSAPIYDGQIISENPLTGYEFDFAKKGGALVGYCAYFKLLNGYESTLFMSIDQLKSHGLKYSQTFKKGFGLWSTDFEAMASKTVLKLLLSKFAPLSIEMQMAVEVDQSVIKDSEKNEFEYVDHTPVTAEENSQNIEDQRILEFIENCKSTSQLQEIDGSLNNDSHFVAYELKLKSLNNV